MHLPAKCSQRGDRLRSAIDPGVDVELADRRQRGRVRPYEIKPRGVGLFQPEPAVHRGIGQRHHLIDHAGAFGQHVDAFYRGQRAVAVEQNDLLHASAPAFTVA